MIGASLPLQIMNFINGRKYTEERVTSRSDKNMYSRLFRIEGSHVNNVPDMIVLLPDGNTIDNDGEEREDYITMQSRAVNYMEETGKKKHVAEGKIEVWREVDGKRKKIQEMTLEGYAEHLDDRYADVFKIIQRVKKKVEDRKKEGHLVVCARGLVGVDGHTYNSNNMAPANDSKECAECIKKNGLRPCAIESATSTQNYSLVYLDRKGEPCLQLSNFSYIFPTNQALKKMTQYKNNISKLLAENWKQLGIV